jgi:hypothetical protein
MLQTNAAMTLKVKILDIATSAIGEATRGEDAAGIKAAGRHNAIIFVGHIGCQRHHLLPKPFTVEKTTSNLAMAALATAEETNHPLQ